MFMSYEGLKLEYNSKNKQGKNATLKGHGQAPFVHIIIKRSILFIYTLFTLWYSFINVFFVCVLFPSSIIGRTVFVFPPPSFASCYFFIYSLYVATFLLLFGQMIFSILLPGFPII